jgi:adenylate cyclase
MAASMAHKLVLRRKDATREWSLEQTPITLGRDTANHIVVDDGDLSVSRFHARLERQGPHWRIVDTNSRNRVRVNGELIGPGDDGARILSDGDAIVIGSCELRFVREESERIVFDATRPDNTSSSQIRRLAVQMQDLPGLLGAPPAAALSKDAEEALERAKKALNVLTAVGRRIAAVTPVDDIIDAIVDLVFVATPAQRAALFLWDDDVRRLVPKRTRTRASGEAITLTVSESLVQEAFVSKSVVQMDPAGQVTESMTKLRLTSAVAVPLLDESKAVGVIYADTSALTGAFDPFGVALLSALSSHTAIALEQARLLRHAREEERKRVRLERYLARGVVDRILAAGESTPGFSMRAEEADVTVLFCDMAGFTARTENMPPQEVLLLLNRCFSHMTEVVQDSGGTVDKYIGDCLMAVFGAPFPQADHARRAAMAALGLRDVIQQVNRETDVEVGFRIGMHSGKVVAGDVGHVSRRDWTVLGNTVNLASRIESAIAQPGQIVLTGETRAALGEGFDVRPIGVVQLPKGITRGFEAFELLGFTGG